jgi:D-alanine-D-alanine ligase
MTMDKKLRIVVIFGGRSGEHEVSLSSAQSVLEVLNPDKYEVYQVGIAHNGQWLTGIDARNDLEKGNLDNLTPCTLLPISSQKPAIFLLMDAGNGKTLTPLSEIDVVFPALHGTFGEDGSLQGLLELADVAYVGATVTGSAVGMDKGIFKDVMRSNGIPTVESAIVLRTEIETKLADVISKGENLSPYPLFVKPANLGSSVGISKCNNRSDLVEGLIEAASYDRRILIEKGLEAREIEVAVLGNDDPQASVAGEILPSREFYSYESKYLDGTSGLLIPAPLPADTSEQIRHFAIQAFKAIDCSGMARVDFFLEKETGKVFLNEVNTIPGFTSISMYPKLWDASGLPYPQLVDRLIDLALERKKDRDRTERSFRRTL